ncbi:MAG: hypothetical protein ACYC1U_04035 [Candidatus Aquicultorales bacterium]
MDRQAFLRLFQKKSGIYLLGEGRRSFLEECGQLLYLETEYLDRAVQTAARTGTFDLRYMEAVALNVRHSKATEGKVIDFLKARRKPR